MVGSVVVGVGTDGTRLAVTIPTMTIRPPVGIQNGTPATQSVKSVPKQSGRRKTTSKEVLLRDIAKIESSTDENRKRIGSLLKRMLAREIFASSSAIREYLETIGLNSRAKKWIDTGRSKKYLTICVLCRLIELEIRFRE